MPTYEYLCPNGHEYEEILPISDYKKKTQCPTCKRNGKKRFSHRQSQPTFTDKLYPYWDRGLNKVFHTPQQRQSYLKEKGYEEKPSKSMDRKQERLMYESRLGNHDPRLRRYAG